MLEVNVIGAGLAGCEAAWQLAQRGIHVTLTEMKPKKMTPAHHCADFAELVCSNSLRGDRLENAVGLLKEELRRLGSLILACAEANRVEAGGALAVDRYGFSGMVTEKIRSHPNITVVEAEATEVPAGPVIVATGPLTSDAMSAAIQRYFGGQEYMSFFDAAAPLVTFSSIDMEKAWFASRYDRGDADYVNCSMDKDEYLAFVEALRTAEEAPVHGFEDKHVFEGCMPVEVMARRGVDTLRYGPLKPVGLKDPKTGKEPYAVVQLRQDNADIRLTPLGYEIGLISRKRYDHFVKKNSLVESLVAFARGESVKAAEINGYLKTVGSDPLTQGRKLHDILMRNNVTFESLQKVLPKLKKFIESNGMDAEVVEEAEIQIKYKGYIEREKFIAEKLHRLENIVIPSDFDFHSLNSLTIEARQKLTRIRPATIGQASRIPGVSPADVNVLLVKFGR